jgi:hypothetical protein
MHLVKFALEFSVPDVISFLNTVYTKMLTYNLLIMPSSLQKLTCQRLAGDHIFQVLYEFCAHAETGTSCYLKQLSLSVMLGMCFVDVL